MVYKGGALRDDPSIGCGEGDVTSEEYKQVDYRISRFNAEAFIKNSTSWAPAFIYLLSFSSVLSAIFFVISIEAMN